MSNFIILIPILYLLAYWVFAFFIVYHLIKYGVTAWPKRIAALFLAGSLFLSILNFMIFLQIDWNKIISGEQFKPVVKTNTK